MNAPSNRVGAGVGQRSAVNRLVLSAVNAPYRRSITADVLAACLATTNLDEWTSHVANFFSDVSPDLVLAFAELHGVPASKVALAYSIASNVTGESNPDLEIAFASLAPAA